VAWLIHPERDLSYITPFTKGLECAAQCIDGVLDSIDDVTVNGAPDPRRLPGNAHFTFAGCEGDSLLMLLDANGIECSTGSPISPQTFVLPDIIKSFILLSFRTFFSFRLPSSAPGQILCPSPSPHR
jgi:cysteine sulfinate desulfinase/cysteine desulfurase-like protein